MDKKLYIVTGEIGSGKTTWLFDAVNFIESNNRSLFGVLSPGKWDDGKKIGINSILLPKKIKYNLATKKDNKQSGFSKKWHFDDSVIKIINDYFKSFNNEEYLIIDELGPLEIEHNKGLVNAKQILIDGTYNTAFVVIRPHLITTAKQLFSNYNKLEVINVSQSPQIEAIIN